MKRTNRARAGFTLLELVIVVAILAILAGVAVPSGLKALERAARSATKDELVVLADATAAYFRDTWELPEEVADLEVDPGVRGWTGPYVRVVGRDGRTGRSSIEMDGWSFPYAVERLGDSRLALVSPGPDGLVGEGEDLRLVVDVTADRRAVTLERLATLNQAIRLYNATWMTTEPLPAGFAAVHARLVERGLLPRGAGTVVDGWGDAFVPDPPAATPVVRVTSRHLAR